MSIKSNSKLYLLTVLAASARLQALFDLERFVFVRTDPPNQSVCTRNTLIGKTVWIPVLPIPLKWHKI